jgi:hypothetical protein
MPMPEQNANTYLDQQSSRVDATLFDDNDTRIDLHASNLAQVAQIAAAREAIVHATKPEQLTELPFIKELRREGRELKRFRSEYDANTFNLHEDETDQNAAHLTQDKFDLAA